MVRRAINPRRSLVVIVAVLVMAVMMPVDSRPSHECPIAEQGANRIGPGDDNDHRRPIEVRAVDIRPLHHDDARHVGPRHTEPDRDADPRLRRGGGRNEGEYQAELQSYAFYTAPPPRPPVGKGR